MWRQKLFPGSMDSHKANTIFCVSHPYTFAGFCLTSVCLSIDMPEHSIGRIPLVRYGVHNRPRAKWLSLWLSHKNTAEGWWHVFEHVISAIYKTTEGNVLLRNCSFKAQDTYWRTCVLSLTFFLDVSPAIPCELDTNWTIVDWYRYRCIVNYFYSA